MKKSIDLAAKSPLLSNYKIYATKSCQPAPKEIKGNILKEFIQIGIKSILLPPRKKCSGAKFYVDYHSGF